MVGIQSLKYRCKYGQCSLYLTLSALQCMTVHKMFVFIIIIPFESGERVFCNHPFLDYCGVFYLVSKKIPKTSFWTAIIMYIMLFFLNMNEIIYVLVIISSSSSFTDKNRHVPQLLVRAN